MLLIHSLIINEGLGFWRIGKVLSGKKGGIASLCSGTTGPEKVKAWNYWNGEKWITTPNVSDRVTISLEGMYNIAGPSQGLKIRVTRLGLWCLMYHS